MIKTTISSIPHEIPSSWNDVTFLKYCDVVMVHDQPFMNRLSVYTGIEVDVLNKLTFPGLQQLIETTAFMDNPDDVMAFAEGYESEINIGHETYGKMETSKQAIQQAKIPLLGAVTMIKEYTGQDISNLPITKTIGQAVFFLTRLESLWRSSLDLMTTNQTPMKWKQVSESLQSLVALELRQPTPVRTTWNVRKMSMNSPL